MNRIVHAAQGSLSILVFSTVIVGIMQLECVIATALQTLSRHVREGVLPGPRSIVERYWELDVRNLLCEYQAVDEENAQSRELK
jgi:hypothetical protein